jgi:hypothetical protein
MDHVRKIWDEIIQPDVGTLPPAVIRHALNLNALDEFNSEFHSLSMKARDGAISPEEASKVEVYAHAFALVRALKAKACRSLEQLEPPEENA